MKLALFFGELFGEIVNLDTIRGDDEKIRDLVQRGIADKASLSPECKIIGERKLTEEERQMLREIDTILEHDAVRRAIEENIFIRFEKIHTVFFDLGEQHAVLATGLFDGTGQVLEEAGYSNIDFVGDRNTMPAAEDNRTILLGLCRDHPFIQHLIDVDDPHKAYYALTFLAHELTLCQKLLVPYSPFYHVTAQKLAAVMRKALMKELLSDKSAQRRTT